MTVYCRFAAAFIPEGQKQNQNTVFISTLMMVGIVTIPVDADCEPCPADCISNVGIEILQPCRAESAGDASSMGWKFIVTRFVVDLFGIAASGLMRTPGLIINGKIKSMVRVPGVKEIKLMIQDAR